MSNFLISNYLDTFQKDIIAVVDYATGKKKDETRLTLLAARISASVCMLLGAVATVSGLTFIVANPVGALFISALGVGTYVLGHELFLVSRNAQNNDKLTKGTIFPLLCKRIVSNEKIAEYLK